MDFVEAIQENAAETRRKKMMSPLEKKIMEEVRKKTFAFYQEKVQE